MFIYLPYNNMHLKGKWSMTSNSCISGELAFNVFN